MAYAIALGGTGTLILLMSFLFGNAFANHTPDHCVESKVDLVFLVDGSSSICDADPLYDSDTGTCNNWESVLDFIYGIVVALPIGPDDVQVALVTFSTWAERRWDLNTYHNKTELLDAIEAVNYPRGLTNAHDAFLIAWDLLKDRSFGAREGVPKLTLIITDGIPNMGGPNPFSVIHDTLEACAILKETGTDVIAVGVTLDVDADLLKEFSSTGQIDIDFFPTGDFDQLEDSVTLLVTQTCSSLRTETVTTDNFGSPCNNTDLMFVVQRNQVLSFPDFHNVKLFLQAFVLSYVTLIDIADAGTIHVGVVYYDDVTHVAFDLDAGYSLANIPDLVMQFMALPFEVTAGSDLVGAILTARDILDTQGTPTANKVMIIISDGYADQNMDQLTPIAEGLEDDFIRLLVLGLGDDLSEDNLDELIHQDPNSIYTSNFADFTAAQEDIIDYFLNNTCSYKKLCTDVGSVCSKTCGIGTFMLTSNCAIYLHGIVIDEHSYSYETKCCIQSCDSVGRARYGGNPNGHRGNHNKILCKNLPTGMLTEDLF